jgi:hypothetical protein
MEEISFIMIFAYGKSLFGDFAGGEMADVCWCRLDPNFGQCSDGNPNWDGRVGSE